MAVMSVLWDMAISPVFAA